MPWQNGIWVPNPNYEQCQFVNEGETVYAPYDNKGTAIKCTVQTAAGNHALVINKKHNFSKWLDVLELYRHKPQPIKPQ